jgi:hypothetical protein
MTAEERHEENQAAYRRLKPTIDRNYPHGWFVAIDEGRVVADAATLDGLTAALQAAGKDSRDVLAVQAGVDYPDFVHILADGHPG